MGETRNQVIDIELGLNVFYIDVGYHKQPLDIVITSNENPNKGHPALSMKWISRFQNELNDVNWVPYLGI